MESAADDVCGGGGRCTLAEDLARMQTMLRELEANMDRQDHLPPAAREICGEMALRVDRSLRIVKSWGPGPESPGSDDGSPRGNASKNAAPFKRRKGVPSVRQQVRVTPVQGTAPAPDDGFSWRKYGQKDILGAKYPRAYFRCTHRHTQSCLATKQVQRADADPLLFDVVYHGAHTCVQGAGAHHLGTQPAGHTAQEQGSLEAGGLLQAGFEPTTPPFPFAACTDPAGADSYPTLLSPTGLEWPQLRSSHAAAMDFDHQMEYFFSNPCDSFQWFQELHLAN